MNGCYDRFRTFFNGADGGLEGVNVPSEVLGCSCWVEVGCSLRVKGGGGGGEGLDVETGCEGFGAGAGEDDGAG